MHLIHNEYPIPISLYVLTSHFILCEILNIDVPEVLVLHKTSVLCWLGLACEIVYCHMLTMQWLLSP